MKNLAIIGTIFFAGLAVAAAQQPATPQSAMVNSGRPISVGPENQESELLPGKMNNDQPQPQSDLKKMAEDLNEHQRGVVEQHNQQMKQRFTSLQQGGGWQREFLTQLKLQWLANPKATPQLNAAQQFITTFVFCEHPLIAGQTSEFRAFTNNLRLDVASKQFAVEPMASIIINGCSFGPETGEVRLILNHDDGSFLPLQVSDWSDSSIFATLGANPGVSDKEAQLVVVRKDGTQSKPMKVQFFQHRMFHVTSFDAAADKPVRTF